MTYREAQALIAKHGPAAVLEAFMNACRELEQDSRDSLTADAWAEIASATSVALPYARTWNAVAMSDFAPTPARRVEPSADDCQRAEGFPCGWG